ncbi:MAG: iron ABC transporter permease [Spirochaetes bacterium]|nr:iron ABC transporter permease [Spirochaetota bacterium]
MKKNKLIKYLTAASVLLVSVYFVITSVNFLQPAAFIDLMNYDITFKNVFFNFRIPRIWTAFAIGSALAVSGTVFQALLRNPLADSYTTGVSGGAAFGISLALFTGGGSLSASLYAFGGSILSVVIVYFIQKKFSIFSNVVILAGVALSMIFSSAVMFVYAVSESREVHKAMLWLMGDLSIARYELLPPVFIFIIILSGVLLLYSKHLDIISLGKEYTVTLGISSASIRNIFFCAAVLTSLSVLLGGIIGFIGLMIPHLIRKIFSPKHFILITVSFFCGGIFLAVCDTAGKIAADPFELPAGVMTGFIGGLFFIYSAIRRKS